MSKEEKTERTKYYNMFNTTLENLIKDLIQTFPNDSDFKMFKVAFSVFKVANFKKPLDLYYLSLTDEYKQNIRDENDKFFLDNDYSDVLSNREVIKNIPNDDFSTKLIKKLKKYWTDLNNENKAMVWKYFLVLLQISEHVKENKEK
tara:strand:- start:37 stop:474 length:438 start_codon:yes stop_codon:yes gene_type:complete